jgi:prepilin-type N-terminal cleavage/methylation domain-containing protein
MLQKKSAFTLIELLVVIVIIGILATIGTAQFNDYQERARFAKALTFSRQVSTKMDTFLEKKIGYWPIEKNITPRLDYSGNDNDLVPGQVTTVSDDCFHHSSKYCERITQNGSYRYESLGNNVSFPNNLDGDFTEFTISYWIKGDPNTAGTGFHFSGSDFSVYTGLYSDGRVAFSMNNPAQVNIYSDEKTTLGNWTHLAFSYDGENLGIYIDGKKDKEITLDPTWQNMDFSTIESLKSGYIGSGEVYVDAIHFWGNSLEF